MQTPIFFAASDLSSTASRVAQQFGLDLPHFIAQCLSFSIVAFILHRFAYKPVLAMLEERRKKIAEGLANAEQIKKDLANAQAKAQEILNQASAQSTKMIAEARAAAAKVQETETQKAIAAANDIVAKARQAMEAEHGRMLTDLRREVGRLVAATASKVTGKILLPEDQQRLIEEANQQVAA